MSTPLAMTEVTPTMSKAIRQVGFANGILSDYNGYEERLEHLDCKYLGVILATNGKLRTGSWSGRSATPSFFKDLEISNMEMIRKIVEHEFDAPSIMVGKHKVVINSNGGMKVGCVDIPHDTVVEIITAYAKVKPI